MRCLIRASRWKRISSSISRSNAFRRKSLATANHMSHLLRGRAHDRCNRFAEARPTREIMGEAFLARSSDAVVLRAAVILAVAPRRFDLLLSLQAVQSRI